MISRALPAIRTVSDASGALRPTLTMGPKIHMIKDSSTRPIRVQSQREVRIDQRTRRITISKPFLDQHLDPAVQRPALTGVVAGHWFGGPATLGTDPLARYAVRNQ